MDATEIIVREMQRRSGLEVVQFLAETIAQAGQPPHGHPNGEVLALNQAS